MTDTDKTTDTKDLSESSASTAPTSLTSNSEKQSVGRSRESTSNYASSSSGDSRGRPRTRSELSNPLSKANLEKRGYHTFTVLGKDFHVDKRWKFLRELGQGAYGIVVLAQDTISGENVAIKQVTRVFEKRELAKRALREIVLLRHFNHHENITGLIDMDLLSPDFNEIYLFMEPMEADLHQIIRSGQALTNAHVQYFLYQILRGCKYVHSANVVHRDLKPGNLLVNADCELKICDLGLSRAFERNATPNQGEESVSHMTEYVATRWYRAPEIMLSFKRYGPAIDVWSIGCILAELLGGRPMFKGKDYVDQLNLILKVLGTPEERTIQRIGSEKAQTYIRSLQSKAKTRMADHFPNADPLAIDLLEKMLSFDPTDRITVLDALAHPYLEAYHEIGDEPESIPLTEKWRALEEIETDLDFRKAIWKEVYEFRLSVRSGGVGNEAVEAEAANGEEIDGEVVEVEREVDIVVEDADRSADGPSVLPDPTLDPDARPPSGETTTAVPPDPTASLPAAVRHLILADQSLVSGTDPAALSPHAALPRTPLDPKPSLIPFPSIEDQRLSSRNRAPSSSSTLRPTRSTLSANVDPYVTYARRTNSLIFTPASSSQQPHRRLYSEHVGGGASATADGEGSADDGEYVVAMIRGRAPSTEAPVQVPGKLMRTISTGGLNKLAEQAAAVGKDGRQPLTQADLPASAIPTEFKTSGNP